MTIDAVVLHSGGMDSSICLNLAIVRFGHKRVVSLGFRYHQRHKSELQAADAIASYFGVSRTVIDLPPLPGWEISSLVNHSLPIDDTSTIPNSFVPSRNGLFILMAAPYAKQVGAKAMYLGVMEREGAFSGYPDCYRSYIDAVQTVVRLDIGEPTFCIETPLIHMTKAETLALADTMGSLDFLLEQTVSCYDGIAKKGCGTCPACRLRQQGIEEYLSTRQERCERLP